MYLVQLGPDSVATAALLDLFVQAASKAAFHELRTRQRLGYSVSLHASALHRQLSLGVRVQSPAATPDAVAAAVRGWLAGYRRELAALTDTQLGVHAQVCALAEAMHARTSWLAL